MDHGHHFVQQRWLRSCLEAHGECETKVSIIEKVLGNAYGGQCTKGWIESCIHEMEETLTMLQ